MRWVLIVLGVLASLIGVVWILQGINILPGSFMTGQIRWAVYGAIAVAIGVVVLAAVTRLEKPRAKANPATTAGD